jgi:uncharacterized iron-regulated membrane protein
MKKIIKKIHLWIAFPLGLIITAICLSGAVLVFRSEIEEALYPERYFVNERGDEPIRLEKLIPAVNSQLDGSSVAGVTVSDNPERTYVMSIGGRDAAYVNQYTGELVAVSRFSESFLTKIMQLHRWLLDGKRTTGKAIVGYTTLLFVVILITGVIVAIPKQRRNMKYIFIIHVNRGLKRFWYDLHISAGIYCALILLVLSLTGLTWSFRWYSAGFHKLFGVELPAMPANHNSNAPQQSGYRGDRNQQNVPPEPRGQGGERNRQQTDFSHWQDVLTEIKSKNPDFRTVGIQNGTAWVSQKRVWGNVRASDRYSFDAKTGAIIDYVPYANQDKAMKIRGWLYTLHVGAWGGWFSKIISCIAALVGACLPLTGYYIFWKKRKRGRVKS